MYKDLSIILVYCCRRMVKGANRQLEGTNLKQSGIGFNDTVARVQLVVAATLQHVCI